MDLIKHINEQKRFKRQEAADEKEQNRLAAEKQRKDDAEEMLKRQAADHNAKWEAAEQVRKRQAAEQEQKIQAVEQKRKQEAAEQEEKREAAERAQTHEARQMQKKMGKLELEKQELVEQINELRQANHAQIGRDRETTKTLKQIKEDIEREKLERQEAIRMQDLKFKALMQYIPDAIKLFMNYYRCQRQSSPLEYSMNQSRSQRQTLGYQERLRLLERFELPKDSDNDLHNIFVKSCLLLEDNRGSSVDTAESSKHQNYGRNISISELSAGFDANILSSVMTTINDAENPQVTNLWALHDQVFGGSEDGILISSSVMTSMNDGTRAKEEGDKYFTEKKFKEALECYSKSIDELPTAAAYTGRAMTYIKLNKFSEAEYDCTDALKIDDRYFDAYARRAMTRTKLGFNLEGAFEDVQAALKLESNNQEMRELCAQLMSLKGTLAKEKGNAHLKAENYEEAIECYTKSIDELSTAAAYGKRAMTYIKLNKFIEVEMDCTEALKIDERYFEAYARRAMARTKLGCNLEGALEDTQVALKLQPNNQEMEKLCAELMSLLKAATKAKEEGNKYFKDQRFEEAITSYSSSINKSPTAVAYSNRAMAYIKLDKWMEAENDCTKALKIDNLYFKAYAHRAIAREKLGHNIEGALRDIEDALELEPDNQEIKELHAKFIRVLG